MEFPLRIPPTIETTTEILSRVPCDSINDGQLLAIAEHGKWRRSQILQLLFPETVGRDVKAVPRD